MTVRPFSVQGLVVVRSFFWLMMAASALGLGVPSNADAAIITYIATLDGAGESPPVVSTGHGFAQVDVDDLAQTMRVRVTFSDLIGNTTAAHIHSPTAAPGTGTAGVATQTPSFGGFPLGVTSGSYDVTFDLTDLATYNPTFVTANGGTAAGAEAALLAGLAAGEAYLNIHTTFAPSGEIRGFLRAVPEPSGLVLALVGGICVLAYRRRRG